MDLILLEPGEVEIFFGSKQSAAKWDGGGSLIPAGAVNVSTGNIGPCIEVISISQGMKQQVTTDVSNSARTSGRPVITEFTCVKYVDKSSVYMYKNCLSANCIGSKANPTKIHILRNTGEKATGIITFELRDALISEIHFQSHPNDMPTEQFKLNFTEILWHYNIQTPDAKSSIGKIATGWSIARNQSIGQFS